MNLEKWTEPQKDQLTLLWTEGLSCSQIAAIMGQGISRNAVISKVHRMHLPARRARKNPLGQFLRNGKTGRYNRPPRKRISKAKVRKPLVVLPDLVPLPPPLVNAWEPLPGSLNLSLLSLTDEVCRWMVGGDHVHQGTGFCGLPVAKGRVYCPEHYATSIGKGDGGAAVKAARLAVHFERAA